MYIGRYAKKLHCRVGIGRSLPPLSHLLQQTTDWHAVAVSRPPAKCTPVRRLSQAGPKWVVYTQQTRRVGGAPSSQVPT